MLHDLLTNASDEVVSAIHDWIQDRVERLNAQQQQQQQQQ
jgi:hypothetical protein